MPQSSHEPDVVSVEIEVITDDDYQQTLAEQEHLAEQDKKAREQARQILQRYDQGFTPNLIQDIRLSAFDSLTASRAIMQLLRLSLAEDEYCAVGEPRLTYTRGRNFAIARQCGHVLYQLGGLKLMEHVLTRLIPPFDQDNLSQAWQSIETGAKATFRPSPSPKRPKASH
ncbi:hypothetical protein [Acaryochloris sp. IP29b_bin.137]|uniref:hypothetical protein n=1 Tax=Acaryochloris sp. IP29b_bin.137 TaxID=2969217 RepID=UPI0026030F23|nr:hypothetical protein [Acaryochloris sp. IP29b_bin.137]